MSSLIILILVVLLAVLIIAMTSYYLSNSYAESEINAKAAALVSEGQQVSAAAQMFDADNPKASISSVDDLMPKYLTSIPKSWQMGSDGAAPISLPTHFVRPMPQDSRSEEICLAANKKIGVNSVPSCSDLPAQFLGCCISDATP
jgi:hypothetical protein